APGCVPGFKRSSGPHAAGIVVLFVVLALVAGAGRSPANRGADVGAGAGRPPGTGRSSPRGGALLAWLFVAAGLCCLTLAYFMGSELQVDGPRASQERRVQEREILQVPPGLPDPYEHPLDIGEAPAYWAAQGLALAGGFSFLAAALVNRRSRRRKP